MVGRRTRNGHEMINKGFHDLILKRFLPLAYTCECKGTHPSCKQAQLDPGTFSQSETVWRIALWIKDLETTHESHICTGPKTGECAVCSTDDLIEQQHKSIERVRKLHRSVQMYDKHRIDICLECQELHPCRTIKALEGKTS